MPIVTDPMGNRVMIQGGQKEVDQFQRTMKKRKEITEKFLKSKGYSLDDIDKGKVPLDIVLEARNQPGWKEANEGWGDIVVIIGRE